MPFFGGEDERGQLFSHVLAEVEGFVSRATVPAGYTVLKDIDLLGCAFIDERLADFGVRVEDNRHREHVLRNLARASPYFSGLFGDWKNLRDALSNLEWMDRSITPAEAGALLSWIEALRDTALTEGP